MLTTKVEPIDRDVRLILDEELSPSGRSKQFAALAREFLSEADETNRTVLGRIPPNKTFVDGSEGANLESVKPDGVIVREYELIADLLIWISDRLQQLAPVLTGTFRRSIGVFADGTEVALGARLPPASEYVFISGLPYARKIERWFELFEVVAAEARKRFGNVARIGFAFRTAVGGSIIGGRLGNRSEQRNPAIIVSVR